MPPGRGNGGTPVSASRLPAAGFDRDVFALDLDSLELVESLRTLERLIGSPRIKSTTRVSLRFAIDALRSELD